MKPWEWCLGLTGQGRLPDLEWCCFVVSQTLCWVEGIDQLALLAQDG